VSITFTCKNAFRCFLRNPTGEQVSTLVFPDKASIEYFLNRVESEWGLEQRELVQDKVSYLSDEQVMVDFISKPSGRKMEGNVPLRPKERTKLSHWRKKMPLLNGFADTYPQGLKSIVCMNKKEVSIRYQAWQEALQAANDAAFVNDTGYSC